MKMAKRLEHLAEKQIIATARMADANGDGFLSAKEAVSLLDVEIQQAPQAASLSSENPSSDTKEKTPGILKNYLVDSPSLVEPDTVVFDRAMMIANLSKQSNLTPERVDQLITKALPKGMANVMTSDLCAANEAAQCMGIPGGKIIKFDKPARTT